MKYVVIYLDMVKGRFHSKEELLSFLCSYLKVSFDDIEEQDSRIVSHKFNVDIYVDKSPRYIRQYNLTDAKENTKWFNSELLKDLIKAAREQQVEILKVESL
nr:MAG TPA: hypothetical protein [Caudoviricetes sp.]